MQLIDNKVDMDLQKQLDDALGTYLSATKKFISESNGSIEFLKTMIYGPGGSVDGREQVALVITDLRPILKKRIYNIQLAHDRLVRSLEEIEQVSRENPFSNSD